ncbi:MAG: hypothetical protein GXN93_01175 [Candidatus Diapherotrites archaeon]|nr:hypothetical protein [Candidatus Diapherotrites archaeon]
MEGYPPYWHKGVVLVGMTFLLSGVCGAVKSLAWGLQYSFHNAYAYRKEPAFKRYVEQAVLFERFREMSMDYLVWRPGQGVTAYVYGPYPDWLRNARPGGGWFIGRKHDDLQPQRMSSYTIGSVSWWGCGLGQGRVRWTPDGRFFVTSFLLLRLDANGVYEAGSQIVLLWPGCTRQIVLVEGCEQRLWDPDISVRGLLAYARGPLDFETPMEIVVHDFHRDKKWVVGQGVNPTWSPDGEWLAYTGYDGLYVVRWDGQHARRVATFATQEPMEGVSNWRGPAIWWRWPPRPDWSPDGQWLIYHRREGDSYNIYRLNLATGQAEQLIQDGLHPQWRWPRQKVAYPDIWDVGK